MKAIFKQIDKVLACGFLALKDLIRKYTPYSSDGSWDFVANDNGAWRERTAA
jgi:hypothetical protein